MHLFKIAVKKRFVLRVPDLQKHMHNVQLTSRFRQNWLTEVENFSGLRSNIYKTKTKDLFLCSRRSPSYGFTAKVANCASRTRWSSNVCNYFTSRHWSFFSRMSHKPKIERHRCMKWVEFYLLLGIEHISDCLRKGRKRNFFPGFQPNANCRRRGDIAESGGTRVGKVRWCSGSNIK